jgi:hypothetical protein
MSVLANFNSVKLEEMLKTSQKNVAQQVVSILINCFNEKKHGVLPEIESRLQQLGISNRKASKNFMGKRLNPRETFTREGSRKKAFDYDCAEEDVYEQGPLTKTHKMSESQNNFNREGSRKSDTSGMRLVMSDKTRQSMKPYQSRELRIKNRPGRVLKKAPRRGESAHAKQRKYLISSRKQSKPRIAGNNGKA